jgi:hypothetical protein
MRNKHVYLYLDFSWGSSAQNTMVKKGYRIMAVVAYDPSGYAVEVTNWVLETN